MQPGRFSNFFVSEVSLHQKGWFFSTPHQFSKSSIKTNQETFDLSVTE